MRYREINEARRGGDSNPKMGESDIVKKLQGYEGLGEYYYMSYTVIDKLGINPRSGYNTPIGIYSYPLVDRILNDIDYRGLKGVPYMGDAPYIWVFKPRNIDRGLVIDDYGQSDYDSDREKLFKYVSGRDDRITDQVFDKTEEYALKNTMFKFPAGNLWNLTRILSLILVGEQSLFRFTDKLAKIGDLVKVSGLIGIVNDIFDDSSEYEIEYGNYSVEHVGFDDVDILPEIDSKYSDLLKELKRIYIKNDGNMGFRYGGGSDWRINEVFVKYGFISLIDSASDRVFIGIEDFLKNNFKFRKFIIDPEKDAKLGDLKFKIGDLVRAGNSKATPRFEVMDIDFEKGGVWIQSSENVSPFFRTFERFYKANPELVPDVSESLLEYKKDSGKANNASVMWTYLLYRVLGYEYVDDSGGEGVIHGNEPVQAVFFNRSVIDVVERFVNPVATKEQYGEYTIVNVFGHNKSVEEIEKIDQDFLKKLFMKYYKKGLTGFSSNIPVKFRGHIVLNSSKLKAKLILRDYGMLDYFKSVDEQTIQIMDKTIIGKIFDLERGQMEENKIYPIWKYFIRVHNRVWPEGDRAILNKAYKDNNPALILDHISYVMKKPWPEAEFIILKNPYAIHTYATEVLKSRWPEGERVLRKIKTVNPETGKFFLQMYADDFNISVSDIGNI